MVRRAAVVVWVGERCFRDGCGKAAAWGGGAGTDRLRDGCLNFELFTPLTPRLDKLAARRR